MVIQAVPDPLAGVLRLRRLDVWIGMVAKNGGIREPRTTVSTSTRTGYQCVRR